MRPVSKSWDFQDLNPNLCKLAGSEFKATSAESFKSLMALKTATKGSVWELTMIQQQRFGGQSTTNRTPVHPPTCTLWLLYCTVGRERGEGEEGELLPPLCCMVAVL